MAVAKASALSKAIRVDPRTADRRSAADVARAVSLRRGRKVALQLRSDAGWERPLIENPALLAADGAYILLYSGGWWESGGYATGYALCDTPLGPCEKQTTHQPILASTEDEAGTGGASVMTGPAGDHWLAYHAWTTGAIGYHRGGARSLRFASLTWDVDQLAVTRQTPPTLRATEAMDQLP